LKSLEEPPKNSFVAISTNNLGEMLPTIISRCRKIFLPLSTIKPISASKYVSNFIKGERIKFKNRNEFAGFLLNLMNVFYDILIKNAVGEKRLSLPVDYGIILKSYSIKELEGILNAIFKVYLAYNSVNQNLALKTIKERLLI